jgi:hypothetical protein
MKIQLSAIEILYPQHSISTKTSILLSINKIKNRTSKDLTKTRYNNLWSYRVRSNFHRTYN